MAVDGFKGRTVEVRELSLGEPDSYGNRQRSYKDPVKVADVLMAPGDPAAEMEEGSPYGAAVSYTLYVPKGSGVSWRGARVLVGGEEFSVVGDPREYPPELVPVGRNLVVKVVRHEGN